METKTREVHLWSLLFLGVTCLAGCSGNPTPEVTHVAKNDVLTVQSDGESRAEQNKQKEYEQFRKAREADQQTQNDAANRAINNVRTVNNNSLLPNNSPLPSLNPLTGAPLNSNPSGSSSFLGIDSSVLKLGALGLGVFAGPAVVDAISGKNDAPAAAKPANTNQNAADPSANIAGPVPIPGETTPSPNPQGALNSDPRQQIQKALEALKKKLAITGGATAAAPKVAPLDKKVEQKIAEVKQNPAPANDEKKDGDVKKPPSPSENELIKKMLQCQKTQMDTMQQQLNDIAAKIDPSSAKTKI